MASVQVSNLTPHLAHPGKMTHDRACMDFEVTRLREEIPKTPEGRCHECHAGFTEWVLPVLMRGRLCWILFAGQARVGGPRFPQVRDHRRSRFPAAVGRNLPVVSEETSEAVLEALRQLRARLVEWHRETRLVLEGGEDASGTPAGSRIHAIRRFLFEAHPQSPAVQDLAAHLCLSENRTLHLVRELFGCGYVELLNQERMKTATSLLRNTSMTVSDICYQSGFRDLSHFHRTFRKRFSVTPLHYRKNTRS